MTKDQYPDEYRNPIHATSVVIGGRALLLAGRSGSGKSDLALRLIDRGALLVSDDYTMLENRDGILFAAAPPQIAGKIEIRGVGLDDLACARAAPVALMLTLDQQVDRMPAYEMTMIRLEGVEIPTLPLAPFEASAPLKAEAALRLRGLEVSAQ